MADQKLTDDEELAISCLVVDKATCTYRALLVEHFGYTVHTECPYRKILKLEFDAYERKKYHEKLEKEFPDES